MKYTPLACAFAVAALFASVPSQAHIEVTYPIARYDYSGPVQKTGPCGDAVGGTATGVVTPLQAGEEVTVQWKEIIEHPGHFRIALDLTNNDAFTDPVDENDMEVKDNIIAYVPDLGGSDFEHTFTLPNVECDQCVLQVMQVMTDKLAGGFGDDDIYYWCADISIGQASGTGGAGGSATGGSGGTGGNGAGGKSNPQFAPPVSDDGCSLASGRSGAAGSWWLLGLAGLVLMRRRKGV